MHGFGFSFALRESLQFAGSHLLTSLLSYYYYLRIAWYMWFRDPDGGVLPEVTLSPALKATLVFAAIAVIALGIFPGELLEAAQRSAEGLMQVPAALVSAGR